MILLGDFYCVIVAVYLLQLYQSYRRLLGHVDCGSFLGYFLGYLLEYFLKYPLRHPLGHLLVYLLRHFIKAQNYYLYNRA